MAVPLFDPRTPLQPLAPSSAPPSGGCSTRRASSSGPRSRPSRRSSRLVGARARGRRRQRHRGADDRPARARRRAGRRGRRAVVHVLRQRRGDPARPGARPVFCDVDPATFCVTPETVRAALTPRTKAVIAVHLFGNVAPVARDRGARRPGRRGRRAGGRLAGAGRAPGALGTVATFSLLPVEEPRRASATAARSRRATTTLAERVRMLRFHGSRDKVTYEQVGYNSRLDELQAAILRVQLPHLDDWAAAPARRPARWYAEAGLGELVALPRADAGRRRPPGTSTSLRHERADELAGGRCRPPASARARTTACRSTASRRWRAYAQDGEPDCRAPRRPRARTSRCRSAPRSRASRSTRSSAAVRRCASGST